MIVITVVLKICIGSTAIIGTTGLLLCQAIIQVEMNVHTADGQHA